jgi:hypothetical protein
MLHMPQSPVSSAPISQASRETNFIPSDPHQIDEIGNPGPFTMELADVYGAILVIVPLSFLAKSLIL